MLKFETAVSTNGEIGSHVCYLRIANNVSASSGRLIFVSLMECLLATNLTSYSSFLLFVFAKVYK